MRPELLLVAGMVYGYHDGTGEQGLFAEGPISLTNAQLFNDMETAIVGIF